MLNLRYSTVLLFNCILLQVNLELLDKPVPTRLHGSATAGDMETDVEGQAQLLSTTHSRHSGKSGSSDSKTGGARLEPVALDDRMFAACAR